MAVLNGKATGETLTGTSGSDRIFGNSGNDFLYGGKGADTISGGHGNDVIVGGDRPDLLYGGAGADTFRLAAPYDSKRWENLYDEIKDFSASQGDRIDLSIIDANAGASGNQAFRFSSGSGEGNLWTERKGADLFVNADIQNGTLITIKLDNFSGQLDGSDFLL